MLKIISLSDESSYNLVEHTVFGLKLFKVGVSLSLFYDILSCNKAILSSPDESEGSI